MAKKKYLSLEEAAEAIGITPEALGKMREAGDVRGFADGATWKFKADSIEELVRSRQADSDPDIPMLPGNDDKELIGGSDSIHDMDFDDLSSSDSDVRLVLDDDLSPSEDSDPEISLPGAGGGSLGDSLSDVRLTGDSDLRIDDNSDSDVQLVASDSDVSVNSGSDSDSDVAIISPGEIADSNVILGASDSDLRMPELDSDSDSDVQLMSGTDSNLPLIDSDSDVALVGSGTDSDIRLIDDVSDVRSMSDVTDAEIDLRGSDSDVVILSDDASAVVLGDEIPEEADASSIILTDEASSVALRSDDDPGSDITLQTSGMFEDADSGITLEADSGINLDAADSGISLETVDSGISLESADSNIAFESMDSGISLESVESGISLDGDDSGISLDLDDGSGVLLDDDSGISLDDADDSGIALDEDVSSTMPMATLSGDIPAGSLDKTQTEMPSLASSGDFNLSDAFDEADDVGADTSVLLFEDDEGDTGVVDQVAPAAAVGGSSDVVDSGSFDDDFEDDDFEDDFEDDDDDLIGADEDAFDDDFEDDEDGDYAAAAAGTAAAAGGAVRYYGGPEVDWGPVPFGLLVFSTLLMTLCCMTGFDLIRGMWSNNDPILTGWLLDALGGLFG